jgi:hypothetical protein
MRCSDTLVYAPSETILDWPMFYDNRDNEECRSLATFAH